MSDKSEIRNSIKKIARVNHNGHSVVCTVDSIDMPTLTCYCIPINGDADIQEVRLMAEVSTGILIIPKINSSVLVTFLSSQSAFVSMFSAIDSIHLNGDVNGGIALTDIIKTKLNVLESQENAIKIIVSAMLAAGVSSPGTPVTNATLAAYFSSFNVAPIIPTTQIEISSTTVKHGNG